MIMKKKEGKKGARWLLTAGCDMILKQIKASPRLTQTPTKQETNDSKSLISMTDVMLKDLTGRPLKACCFVQAAFQTATCYMHAHAHNRIHTGIKQQAGRGMKYQSRISNC